MADHESDDRGFIRRVLDRLGLTYQPGGQPVDRRRKSRYDRGWSAVSSRLDEDIDELRARLERLEKDSPAPEF
jgi:hypothetical protein